MASVALVAACEFAQAKPTDFYIGLEGGLSMVGDIHAFRSHTGVVSGTSNVALGFDPGWALIATVGHVFDNGFRLEGEAGFRNNKMTIPTSSRQGDFDEWSLMLNAAFDMRVGPKMIFTVGGGVGGDQAMFNDGVVDDGDKWRLAYQGLAGFKYALGSHVDLALTYRYLRVDGPSFSGPHAGHVDTYELEDLTKQTVTLGFVFNLGTTDAPPEMPPAPPPVAPPPPRDFVITFDKKCNLSAEADLTLTEAGSAAKQTGSAVVRLVSSGGTIADTATNDCRFRAAKANLVTKGVPEAAVSQSGPVELRIDWR